MTDRAALPFFLNAQRAESWSLQGGGGGESVGDLLCGCLMKAGTLKYVHPHFPLPHLRQNAGL